MPHTKAARRESSARVSRAPRVLVIYKKSAYQIYVRERRHELIERLIEAGEPSAARLLRAHREHQQTIDETRRVLEQLGARAAFRHRSDAEQTESCDLVVTLGGDGTLLWGSHLVGPDVPIVAINTAPEDSVGYFCAGTRADLGEVLAAALEGELRADSLTRMRVDIDGVLVTKRVLNDVLFCHESPASTSRYALRLDGLEEEQKSSGVWVGPAAGSTAAQHSAGGKILPVRSRKLQFVVREPYDPLGQGLRLRRGLVAEDQVLEIHSRMRAGRLFIDGPRKVRTVPMAANIVLRRSDEPLTLLGFRAEGRPGR